MARPQTDIEAGRELLLKKVDELIQERGATDISMTDLATAAGMSPSNIYRFFESKEALLEAVAEEWFADKIAIMEKVVASDACSREKLYAFFADRYVATRHRFEDDPGLFVSYLELGRQHFEVIKGYVDLGDHYLSLIVAEAMEEGFFGDLSIDMAVSLINQMVQPYCNPDILAFQSESLSEAKLAAIIDTIFIGLGKANAASVGGDKPTMQLVS